MTLSLTAPETRTQTQFTQSNGKSIYTHVILVCAIYACVYRYVCVAHVSAYVVQLVGRLTDTLLNFRFLAQAHTCTHPLADASILQIISQFFGQTWHGREQNARTHFSHPFARPTKRQMSEKLNLNATATIHHLVITASTRQHMQSRKEPNQTKPNGTERNRMPRYTNANHPSRRKGQEVGGGRRQDNDLTCHSFR